MLWILYSLILSSSLLVILSKNTVQSVLYLILVFLLCSLLFIYLGADFIGLIILIVYIGAIAVLFLFVVMMLNIRLLEENTLNFYIYIPIIILLSLILIFQVIYFFSKSFNNIKVETLVYYLNWNFSNNIQMSAIGELLFNKLYILFIGAAFLLFIAMIGAIVLTMDEEKFNDQDLVHITVKGMNKTRFYSVNVNWKYIK